MGQTLRHGDVAKVLNVNLKEEKATDKKLNGSPSARSTRRRARKHKKPTRAEREAMMQATVGIPAI